MMRNKCTIGNLAVVKFPGDAMSKVVLSSAIPFMGYQAIPICAPFPSPYPTKRSFLNFPPEILLGRFPRCYTFTTFTTVFPAPRTYSPKRNISEKCMAYKANRVIGAKLKLHWKAPSFIAIPTAVHAARGLLLPGL